MGGDTPGGRPALVGGKTGRHKGRVTTAEVRPPPNLVQTRAPHRLAPSAPGAPVVFILVITSRTVKLQ